MALSKDTAGSSLFSRNVTGTMRLMAYLGLAGVLMVADYHYSLLQQLRQTTSVLVEPVFVLASLPTKLASEVSDAFTDRATLERQNRELQRTLILAQARINRLHSLAEQNRRYRRLLAVQEQLDFSVQTARLVGVDLGPYRDRVVVGAGSNQGVHVGMTVMDAWGVMGQVVEVGQNMAQVMLITDPEHATPGVVERTNLRMIVHGTGQPGRLIVRAIPLSADVAVGDQLMTSGLGGRFPAGFPVGRIRDVHIGSDGMFQVAVVTPAAHLNRSSMVLLLHDLPAPMGPPAPAEPYGPPSWMAPGGTRPASTSPEGGP